jgi:hypothetical protein
VPEFDTWTNQSLVLFAYEAHRRIGEQYETIEALRADIKMLLGAILEETIDEILSDDAGSLRPTYQSRTNPHG